MIEHFELDLPPGIVLDDSDFASIGRWADGDSFRFRHGKPETVGRATEMTSATAVDRANKMLVFDLSGTINLAVAGTALRVGAINAAGSNITPASGWDTGNVRHSLAMWGDILLASCAGGTLFESSGGLQATVITNAPDAITCFVVTPSRQVMALGCNEETSGTFNGRCIRWCDIEDRTSWTTSSTNNAGEYILPGQLDIVGGCVLGDYILIWTEGALWLANFTGDPNATFDFQRVADVGLAGQDAWAILSETVYWVAPDGVIYAYVGGGGATRLNCPLASRFGVGLTNTTTIFACPNSKFGEIWFGWPAGSNAPDQYLVYCVDESARAQRPVWFCGRFDTAYGGSASETAESMVETTLDWDPAFTFDTSIFIHKTGSTGKPWRWDGRSTAGAKSGIADAWIQTGDFYIDSGKRRVMVSRCVPDFDENNGLVELTIYTRDRPLSRQTTKGPYVLPGIFQQTGPRVSGSVSSGATSLNFTGNLVGGVLAGVRFTVENVNEYDGGDTGELMELTLSQDFPGFEASVSTTLNFTPAVVDSGVGQNVTALPQNLATISFLDTPSKKDFRASGMLMAFRFTSPEPRRVRFGKFVFDYVPGGMR